MTHFINSFKNLRRDKQSRHIKFQRKTFFFVQKENNLKMLKNVDLLQTVAVTRLNAATRFLSVQ